jgi:hypothetical protein
MWQQPSAGTSIFQRHLRRGLYRTQTINVPKAHSKDPAAVIARSSLRALPVDVQQLAYRSESVRRGLISMQAWQRRLEQQQAARAARGLDLPVQVQMTFFSVNVALINDVHRLIPKNINRVSFGVSNFTEPGGAGQFLYWTYGTPPILEGGLIGGRTLAAGQEHDENGQSISVDDIFVFTRTANPIYALGWEGTISPQANFTP